MIRTILILGLFVVSFGAMAQEKSPVQQNDLKGPEYKNYKVWMHKLEPTIIQSDATPQTLQGPEYKNRRPGKEASNVEQALVSTVGTEQQKLQGPAYKNYNPHIRRSK